jgi:hypothetical protein
VFGAGGRNGFERFGSRRMPRLRRLERPSAEFSSRGAAPPGQLGRSQEPTFLICGEPDVFKSG